MLINSLAFLVVIFLFFGHNSAPRKLIGENTWKLILPASRSILNPPGPPKTKEKPKFKTPKFLEPPPKFKDY